MMNNQSDKQGADCPHDCPLPIEAYIVIFDCLDYLQDNPEGLDDSHTATLLTLVNKYLPSEAQNALDMLTAAYSLLDSAMHTLTTYPRQQSSEEMEVEAIKAEIAELKQQLAQASEDEEEGLRQRIEAGESRIAGIRKSKIRGKNAQRDMLYKLEKMQGKNRFRVESWINTVAQHVNKFYDDIATLPYPSFIKIYNRMQAQQNLEQAVQQDAEAEQRRQQQMKQ